MGLIHQVIYNMFGTKYIDSILYDYIDPFGVNLASFTWTIISSYLHTLGFTPGHSVFAEYMLFNLMSIIYLIIVATRKFQQVDVYNVQENSRKVRYDYTIDYLVYVENTGIYSKSYYKKQ